MNVGDFYQVFFFCIYTKNVELIPVRFSTGTHVPQRMNCTNFDPLTWTV